MAARSRGAVSIGCPVRSLPGFPSKTKSESCLVTFGPPSQGCLPTVHVAAKCDLELMLSTASEYLDLFRVNLEDTPVLGSSFPGTVVEAPNFYHGRECLQFLKDTFP